MWSYELVPSAGNGESPSSWNSPMSRLNMRFTFAEGVYTTLSLPWSLFEHTVGNWLVLATGNPMETVRIEHLLRRTIDNPSTALWNELMLPTMTAGRLESVLESGRRYFDAVASDSWVGEGDLASRVSLGA